MEMVRHSKRGRDTMEPPNTEIHLTFVCGVRARMGKTEGTKKKKQNKKERRREWVVCKYGEVYQQQQLPIVNETEYKRNAVI